MAISNTSILIKRSSTATTPGTLKSGELAYSYTSNVLFFGTAGGNGVVNVGGQYYTSTVDAATNANTASTLVKRDTNGAFYGRIFGVSNTAVALDTAQNFSVTGGDITASAVSFNGTAPVVLSAALNAVPGLSAGYYGGSVAGSSTIPVVQVAANGRIMSIANTTVTSSFNISDGTTSNTIYSGATFYHKGVSGITTTVTSNTVTIGTDTTVLRSNTTGATQTISTDLTVAGNLIISGTATYVNTATVQTTDSLIKLAANNSTGDVVDIGFYGMSNTNTGLTGSNTYHGLIREGSGGSAAGNFYLFKNLATDPTNNTIVYASATRATLIANLTGGMISGLANTIGVVDGGTGQSTFTSGQILIGSGTNGLTQIANSTVAIGQSFGSASIVPVFTTDAWGRVASVTNTSIAIAASQVTSGQLAIAQGGTNSASYAQNGVLYYNGTSFATSANQTAYTTQGGASYVPSISTNALGQVTAIANTQIQIDAVTNIVSGTLPIARGGTNQTSFTNYGLVNFNGTSLASVANVSTVVTGSLAGNNTITSFTTDGYGRVTAYTGAAISGLTVGQGGTGTTSFTTNGITYGNGTGAMLVTAAAGTSDQTWSNQILTVTNAGVPVWSSAMDGGTF
jgi:hypothetical protein